MPQSTTVTTDATMRALVSHLDDTATVIAGLTPEVYAAEGPGGSTIGQHIRHCLDHVRAFIAGIDEADNDIIVVDYERRNRGCPSECDHANGVNLLRQCAQQIAGLSADLLEQPVTMLAIADPNQPPLPVPSSVVREAAFLLSHGIHHNATISHLMRAHGVPVPDGFGYAPSTLAFLAGH